MNDTQATAGDPRLPPLHAEIERLRAENRQMNQTLASDAIEIFKLQAALEALRGWCADKGDLDGELMAEAALTNERERK